VHPRKRKGEENSVPRALIKNRSKKTGAERKEKSEAD
jgi:hypothetical protein